MSVTVLVVDDSGFFRKRVCEILNSVSDIKVVGTASNGRDAIEQVKKLKPDVVTMDYEMPVMDGVTAVRLIMEQCPTSILMFSSLTYEGARVTLDALEAGAVDFLPKNFEDIARDAGKMQDVLRERILAIAKPRLTPRAEVFTQSPPAADKKAHGHGPTIEPPAARRSGAGARARPSRVQAKPVTGLSRSAKGKPISHPVDLLVIGTSTGGPVALQKIVSKLPAALPVPVLIVQHMPATFTPAFAARLNGLSKVTIKHASDGDILRKGVALLAPGGQQMIIGGTGQNSHVSILEGDARLTYKPSVDITFGSAAKRFPGRVLGIVLTGMGADGREGCRMLKSGGSTVWTQDEASCVIYGMPMAVDKAGYSDESINIDHIADRIISGIM